MCAFCVHEAKFETLYTNERFDDDTLSKIDEGTIECHFIFHVNMGRTSKGLSNAQQDLFRRYGAAEGYYNYRHLIAVGQVTASKDHSEIKIVFN